MEEVTADYHGHCSEGLQSNLQSLKGNVTLLPRPPPILPENGPLLKKGTCKGTLCGFSSRRYCLLSLRICYHRVILQTNIECAL